VQGTVVFFSGPKGYGFIRPTSGEKDVFVHFTAIMMDGYKELKQDDEVEFEVTDGPKGKQAANVRRLED
jgi:CspA family cold shock protein